MRDTILASLLKDFAGAAEASLDRGTLALVVAPQDVVATATRLRRDFGFDLLLDVTAIDWPARALRFDVVWHFYSTTERVRARMKTAVAEASPEVGTLTGVYGSAAFMERECHDMYGIRFLGNGDMRPILLYEGFVGHPLRKDYAKDHEQPLVTYREHG